jgi:hypothetical protein
MSRLNAPVSNISNIMYAQWLAPVRIRIIGGDHGAEKVYCYLRGRSKLCKFMDRLAAERRRSGCRSELFQLR